MAHVIAIISVQLSVCHKLVSC